MVFVGDLIDRGPDSPAVAELAMQWAQRGHAQCVLGNHELNLLRQDAKSGNAWAIDPACSEQQPGGEFAHSRVASAAFKSRFLAWLATLPVALERADLRVVHAACVPGSIDALRSPGETPLQVLERYDRDIALQLHREGPDVRMAADARRAPEHQGRPVLGHRARCLAGPAAQRVLHRLLDRRALRRAQARQRRRLPLRVARDVLAGTRAVE